MGLFSMFSSKKNKKENEKKEIERPVAKSEVVPANKKLAAPQKVVKTEDPKISEQVKTTTKSATVTKASMAEKEPAKPATEKKAATAAKPAAEKKAPTPAKAAPSKAAPAKAATKAQSTPATEDDAQIDGSVAIESKTTRSGKFDIRRAKDGRFYFNLYASNKAVIAYSQMYSSSTTAINGIKSVISHAPKAALEDNSLKNPETKPFPKWEIYVDKAGQYRFRLYASNGNCVCHSHGYDSKSGCKGGIESITRISAETAEIDKSYLK